MTDAMIAEIQHSIRELHRDVTVTKADTSFNKGSLEGLGSAVARLQGSFDNFTAEMRAGQGAQDTRINGISSTQARHSGIIGIVSLIGGAAAGYLAKFFDGGLH